MTALELLSDYDLGPGDQRPNLLHIRLFVMYLADHVYDLRDASDFRQLLLEISDAARILAQTSANTKVPCTGERGTRPAAQKRWDETCPRCGHVHEGVGECGVSMGRDRLCRCETEVPA